MGKLRLKLQAMMPSVWYRRLKMELGMRATGSSPQGAINYKRWSSQRKQLGSSKKLLKASPNIRSSSSFEERESHQNPPPPEERECASKTHRATSLLEQRGFAPSTVIAQLKETPSHAAEKRPIQERKTLSLEEGESHPGALCNTQLLPLQAPSLSSPLPLPDKSFQLNLQELNSKLQALNYDERRAYFSSPIFAAATPTPVFDKLDLEPDNESLAARKLFPEEVKLFTHEACRSSYGSTSFTGQSITSSEDTACDKVSSSSVWERDFSSLPSEGSELFPAMQKIRNTVAFLRRKSRKARKDASTKQRRRQKGKLSQGLDEYGHLDGGISCIDSLCQCRADDEKVPSIEKMKIALAGSRVYALQSSLAPEVQSMQAQSEYLTFNAIGQEGDDFVRHRRSVSNDFLFWENIGVGPAFNRFSPWQHDDAGFDKFSPKQCSDSAFSDSELENSKSHRRIGMHLRYNAIDEHRRPIPKQGVYLGRNPINTSPLFNEAHSEVPLPSVVQDPPHLPHPFASTKSKSICRSLHSNAVCNGNKSLSSSSMASFDANPAHSPSFKSRGRYRWVAPAYSHDRNHITALLSEGAKSGLNTGSPSTGIGTPALNGSPYYNQCKDPPKSFNAWGASPEFSSRSKILNAMSNISSDGDDYDGDVSLRSCNERPMAALCKSYSKREQDGKERDNAAILSKNISSLTTKTSVHQSWVPPIQKSASKRSINGDHDSSESLGGGLISVPSWSMLYSKGEGDGKASGILASLLMSPSSNMLMKDDAYGYDCKLPLPASSRSMNDEQDGNENLQSHSRVTYCAWSRSPISMQREEDGKEGKASIGSLIEREMGGSGVAKMSKSYSRREELDGIECRADLKEGNKKGEDERGGLTSGGHKGGDVAGVKESAEKGTVYESFAMVKCSDNPSQDFKESMMEMVLHKKLHESLDLVELLQCYLSLNSPRYHDIIVKAFIDLWSDLFRPSI